MSGKTSRLLCALAALFTMGAPAVHAQGSSFESGVDRPGMDFRNFEMPNPDPAACRSACVSTRGCRAWTYVNPGVQGPRARCWLKSSVPAAVANRCCVSGVASQRAPAGVAPAPARAPAPAARAAPGMEMASDRPGGDYSNFDLPSPDPGRCQAACGSDARCRAWTYVNPGVQGQNARCWLKASVPQKIGSSCCISGVAIASGAAKAAPAPSARICPNLVGPPLEQTRVLHMNTFGSAANYYFNREHNIYCGYGAIHSSEFNGEYLRQEGNGFVGYALVNGQFVRRTFYNRERTETAPNGKVWDVGQFVGASDPRRSGGWRATWQ